MRSWQQFYMCVQDLLRKPFNARYTSSLFLFLINSAGWIDLRKIHLTMPKSWNSNFFSYKTQNVAEEKVKSPKSWNFTYMYAEEVWKPLSGLSIPVLSKNKKVSWTSECIWMLCTISFNRNDSCVSFFWETQDRLKDTNRQVADTGLCGVCQNWKMTDCQRRDSQGS